MNDFNTRYRAAVRAAGRKGRRIPRKGGRLPYCVRYRPLYRISQASLRQ